MKHFITEKERRENKLGTCYLEFTQNPETETGELKYWDADSINLHYSYIDYVGTPDYKLLTLLFYKYIPDFDIYMITEVKKEDWEKLVEAAVKEDGTIAKEVILEADSWARPVLEKQGYFVIIGM